MNNIWLPISEGLDGCRLVYGASSALLSKLGFRSGARVRSTLKTSSRGEQLLHCFSITDLS
ncbi:hypothetical protein L484_010366 [Morus notabilis]|uniref:Uncharacterized protein n=1 Tax=Morus notabilis TaxID=981085 RepID=W9RZ64_9ROSA|nr:hypothetical protein L484_010366 [Morus notabilis]